MDGVIGGSASAAQAEAFDLVVVGAGIHGATASLAAARGGHRVLLLERGDFGGATSWNSLRTLHGGLRYLQSLDLSRFRESVEARSWYLDRFPELVESVPCLMPLYGKGLRRRATLGPALALNERLRRRWGSAGERELIPAGGLVSSAEVRDRFDLVRAEGLRGGALWYEGFLSRPQRMLIEILRRAAAHGAVTLNYIGVSGWETEGGRIAAVRARDTLDFREYEFRTRAVLNCAGPWAPALVGAADPALARAFHPSLAFNLLLDRPLGSRTSVAVEPAGGGRTYFLHPLGEWTLAGTFHAPMTGTDESPDDAQIETFLEDLRRAVPAFGVTRDDVLRVMAGVLPARRAGTEQLADRVLHHEAAAAGGPEGLHSLVGIKYTTAPLAADRAVRRVLGSETATRSPRAEGPPIREVPGWTSFGLWADRDPGAAAAFLDAIVREEAVRQPDDLLLRRTDWGLDPRERTLADARIRQLRPDLFSSDE